MKLFELVKLQHRAKKYRTKEDPGGISYILSNIKEGDTVLDIGAHKGGYLYYLTRQVGKSGTVFAFEPQRILFEYLKKIKHLFHWDNVTVERIAMSDSRNTVPLFIPDNKKSKSSSPGASLLKQENRSDYSLVEEVATDYLDDFCKRKDLSPSFLKVDVEGNELKIFKGGVEVLKKNKPRILVEIEARHVGQDQAKETFDYLIGLGYKAYFLKDGRDKTPLSEFNFDKHQNTNDMGSYCNNFIFE